MSDTTPAPLNLQEFLKNDKENLGSDNHKDSDGNQVRFHAANKEFYQIDYLRWPSMNFEKCFENYENDYKVGFIK